MAKQYGLITKDNKVITRPSIFNEDSDSNDDQDKPTGITVLKKKERMAQQKAIDEDPTIYQYDELYDDMQSKRKESKLARKDLDRKPKYINKLLESAERRKKEYERRIERDVQKEREAEGDLYKDKESFVTSAYRKKLEEMKELEEKEKREEYLEAIGDVKKQGDLSGFYRHLYAQQVNYDENSLDEKKKTEDTAKKPEEPSNSVEEPPKLKETSKWEDESSETSEKLPEKKTEDQKDTTVPSKKLLDTKKRKYRKREDSKSEDEPEKEEDKKLHHIQSNLDADSDFSIDSESDSDSESESKKQKTDKQITKNDTEENKTEAEAQDSVKVEENKDVKKEENVSTEDKKDEPVEPKKPKIDIWKKRTVGDVFDEALKRYYERKAGKIQTVN